MTIGYLLVMVFCLGTIATAACIGVNCLSRIEATMGRMEKLLTDIRDSHDHAEGFRRFDK